MTPTIIIFRPLLSFLRALTDRMIYWNFIDATDKATFVMAIGCGAICREDNLINLFKSTQICTYEKLKNSLEMNMKPSSGQI